MAKDPAFLFYSSDFLSGTHFFTYEQRGQYITLLCMQHQQGSISERHMILVCGDINNEVVGKFKKGIDGKYYNERLLLETDKRNKYSESRRNNRNKGNNSELYIYLMKNKDNGHYKIGSSVNPERRLLELKRNFPNIVLLYSFGKTAQTTETLLHTHFSEKCVYNEFFALSNEDVVFMCNHMTEHMKLHMTNHMENENENKVNNKVIDNTSNDNTIISGEKFFLSKYRENHFPTPQAVYEASIRLGSDIKTAANFFNYYEGIGWKKGITPISNWVSFLNKWVANPLSTKPTQQAPKADTIKPFVKPQQKQPE